MGTDRDRQRTRQVRKGRILPGSLDFRRQADIFNPEEYQETISIIGAGNIGSTTAYALTKMGLEGIIVYDFDKVENHNLSSQFFGIGDVGKLKTKCLKDRIKDFTGIDIFIDGKFVGQKVYGILVIAVDSMEERKKICEAIKKDPPRTIIDGRMGGNTIEVYTRTSPEEYEKTLETSVEAVPCSARYISYTSLLMAGLISNQVKRILKGEPIKNNIILDVDTSRFA